MSFHESDDEDDSTIISEGPVAVVTRILSELPDGPRLIAIKTSTTAHAKEPHDIIKEARLLSLIAHQNIIPLVKQELSQRSQSLSLWMPYVPYSLDEVLRSSRFSPHPIISFGSRVTSTLTPREVQFLVLAKSIIFQILCGVSYLHSEDVQIAHRDIKPSNVLLTASGRVQLIDFGIAFRVDEPMSAKSGDLWSESIDRMYFEVSTGPYRAPELLFGARTYDAFSIDAWSLGVTLSDFFAPLRLQTDEDDEDRFFECESKSDSESDATSDTPAPPPTPFIIPRGTGGIPTGRWTRTSLFDSSRGEIGLAWSIFKIRGTPNEHTWPSFSSLPDAGKLVFVNVEAMDLPPLLPNLPQSASMVSLDTKTHIPLVDMVASPVDLILRFLVHEPSRRFRASDALRHPWFTAEPGLVLPEDYSRPSWMTDVDVQYSFILEGQACGVKDLLHMHVSRPESAEH